MNQRIVLRGIFAVGLSLLLTVGAQAQAFRTYLSGSGNDSNPCSLVAPCRLLPAALAAVIDGGEIWMLDSANYNSGPVNVNKSVTILAVPGALGSVVALGGNAINISTPGVKVALRNLEIVPFVGGSGTNGIFMTAGASLTVDNCLIANLWNGIYVGANLASVLVTDTVIRGNSANGLYVTAAHATVTRSTISRNTNSGVLTQGSVFATETTTDITDSTINANVSYGVYAMSNDRGAPVKVSVRNSQVVQNGYGLLAQTSTAGQTTLSASNNVFSNNLTGLAAWGTGTKVWASGNTVSDNLTGLENSGALFESAGDNAVRNNGTDTSGPITAIPKL